jgi:thiamine-phosphate pyrophosphorylase
LLKPSHASAVNRIIDANLNRLKEGLRVCEEVVRFALDDRRFTSELKQLRHRIDSAIERIIPRIELCAYRDSLGDVGRDVYGQELRRKNLRDIFFANMQRVKESIRVLEELSKLKDRKVAVLLKRERYRIYEIEKRLAKKIAPLRTLP